MESPTQVIPVPAGLLAGDRAAVPYAVKLPTFEGPLDLLLHLIRLNEVEITEIPIARVCEQYLAYLELMHELNIDVASDYLVMAATLAWIKSQMLLPVEVEDDEDAGIDPREELVRRLLEYQRYKEVAEQIGDRHRLGRDIFPARITEPESIAESEREISADLTALLRALRDVLKTAPHSGAAHELLAEPVTVRERMIAVMGLLADEQPVDFVDLLLDAGPEQATRTLVVATFLAILELARLGALRIYQGPNDLGAPEGPIHVRGRAENNGDDWLGRISEYM